MAIPTLAIIGFILSLVILLFNHRNIYLSIFYFLLSLNGLFLYLIFISERTTFSAIFLVHAFPLFLLIGPVLWFYVRGEITNQLKLKPKDSWHLIPFILNTFQIIPYSIKPWSYKVLVANSVKTFNLNSIKALHLPFISFWGYFSFKSLFFFAYLIFCIYFLFNNLHKPDMIKAPWKGSWLKWFLSLNFVVNIISILVTIICYYYSKTSYPGTIAIIISSVFGTFLFLSTFLFPKILYGNLIKNEPQSNQLNVPTEIEITDFSKILQTYIDERKYLQTNFSKAMILSEVGISDRLFTYYFNEHLQSNFIQWRNKYRLDYSMELIAEGYLKNHTIESLAKIVGFQSRNSFTNSFKAQFGASPSAKINR
jgi:AraC-like DNA-binding protein